MYYSSKYLCKNCKQRIIIKKKKSIFNNQELFRHEHNNRTAETSTSPFSRNFLPVIVLMERMEFSTRQVYKDRRMRPRTSGHIVFGVFHSLPCCLRTPTIQQNVYLDYHRTKGEVVLRGFRDVSTQRLN